MSKSDSVLRVGYGEPLLSRHPHSIDSKDFWWLIYDANFYWVFFSLPYKFPHPFLYSAHTNSLLSPPLNPHLFSLNSFPSPLSSMPLWDLVNFSQKIFFFIPSLEWSNGGIPKIYETNCLWLTIFPSFLRCLLLALCLEEGQDGKKAMRCHAASVSFLAPILAPWHFALTCVGWKKMGCNSGVEQEEKIAGGLFYLKTDRREKLFIKVGHHRHQLKANNLHTDVQLLFYYHECKSKWMLILMSLSD